MTVRIAKYIADCGIASRRDAEIMIQSGRVSINGVKIFSPVHFVGDNDVVSVDNKTIVSPDKTVVYAFHKPLNVMTTARDPNGRKTIYDVLPAQYRNLKYIGRLDYRTTGLLLLTNNGDVARKLTLPSSNIPRVYVATVNGTDFKKLESARRGMTVDGIKYAPMKIDVIGDQDLRIEVREGKKNEIRIVMRACGLPVRRLHRISFGNISLGNIGVGKIKCIDTKTIDEMLKSL